MSVSYDPASLERVLAELADRPIDATEKGFLLSGPIAPAQLIGTSIEVLTLPIAVIEAASLDHNIALMAGYCRSAGIELAPHAKTTMSPQIYGRQLRAGAWGLTVANVSQARVCIDHGVRRVLIANEVVDPRDIVSLARAMSTPGTELICYVDSVRGVQVLGDGLRRQRVDAQLPVLLEVGEAGQRAGVRTIGGAIEVATFAQNDPTLRLVGAAGFEGVLAGDRSPDSLDRVDSFCRRILEIAAAVEPFIQHGHEPMILSAGGSVFFDRVASLLVDSGPRSLSRRVILRSGAYVSHDHGYLGVLSPLAATADHFIAAIEVRGVVLSVPEPMKAIVAIGKRDVGNDLAPPTPIRAWHSFAPPRDLDEVIVSSTDDQHTHLMHRDGHPIEGTLGVGDIVALGIAHPCTTFDRWRFIPIVDDGVIVDVAQTYF